MGIIVTKNNYYLALYQAILDRNITKILELEKIPYAEEENYPNEYPELDYKAIFGEDDPDDFLDALLENDEFKDFYSTIVDTLSNFYYLAYYQAILDRDLAKALALSKYTSDDDAKFPGEYSTLDYNEIFGDNDPVDFISSLLRTEEYKWFYAAFDEAKNPLATKENIAIREEKHLELMAHPLTDYCPNPVHGPSVIDSILSISHSTVIKKEEITVKLTKLIKQSPIIDDVLSIVNSIATINPFSIALIGSQIQDHDPTYKSTTGGYHHPIYNRLVVTNENSELNLGFMTHELSHKAVNAGFDNGFKPYNNAASKERYHTAIKNTLLNIKDFISQGSGLDIIFEDQNDTWQMGKALSAILFPQYLDKDSIPNFISLLKQYNLNIDDKFSWLDGFTPLGIALYYRKFELADALVEAGAAVRSTILHASSISSSMELLNWFLENKQDADMNSKDCYGMVALDYAWDSQMISKLISLGAVAYPPNYQPICSAALECGNTNNGAITEEQLSAIEAFLMLYHQYSEDKEDAEFIVRYPQIIAQGLYKGKVVDIFQPIAEYWEQDMSPVFREYIDRHDMSNPYAPLLDYCVNDH